MKPSLFFSTSLSFKIIGIFLTKVKSNTETKENERVKILKLALPLYSPPSSPFENFPFRILSKRRVQREERRKIQKDAHPIEVISKMFLRRKIDKELATMYERENRIIL